MKFKTAITVILGSLLTLTCAEAKAFRAFGPGSSGGGGGVACVDDVFAPGTNYRDFFRADYNPQGEAKHVYVLDYFQYRIPTIGGETSRDPLPDGLSEDQYMDRLIDLFAIFGDVSKELETTLRTQGPIETWVDSALEIHADSGRAYKLPKGCSYVQLAVRQDDLIYGDGEWISMLTPKQRAFLRLHEALYERHIGANAEGSILTSVPVRRLIGTLLKIESLSPRNLEKAILYSQARGHLNYHFRNLSDVTFDRDNLSEESYFSQPFDVVNYYQVLIWNLEKDPCPRGANDQKDCGWIVLFESRWERAFRALYLAVEFQIGYAVEHGGEIQEKGYLPGPYDLSRAKKIWLNRRPYFEKMKDWDPKLYQGVLSQFEAAGIR